MGFQALRMEEKSLTVEFLERLRQGWINARTRMGMTCGRKNEQETPVPHRERFSC